MTETTSRTQPFTLTQSTIKTLMDIQSTTFTQPEFYTNITNLKQLTTISLSDDDTLEIIITGTLCTCVCKHANQELTESIEIRREKLEVSKRSLSSEIRKRTSASDSRMSSSFIGALAITILVTVFLLFLCSDICSILRKNHPKCSGMYHI